jgi:hypothetical protein
MIVRVIGHLFSAVDLAFAVVFDRPALNGLGTASTVYASWIGLRAFQLMIVCITFVLASAADNSKTSRPCRGRPAMILRVFTVCMGSKDWRGTEGVSHDCM